MNTVHYTTAFKKAYKRLQNSGYDMAKLTGDGTPGRRRNQRGSVSGSSFERYLPVRVIAS